jgi:Fungal specific transcription factor domain
MAEKSALVKHAILSLSATYVMDFKQHRRLTDRANFHHEEAVRLLTEELGDLSIYRPHKEEAVVATLYLMAHNEASTDSDS